MDDATAQQWRRRQQQQYGVSPESEEARQKRLLDEEKDRELAGVVDPKERKRIQNRIAQRLYRQKQKRRLQALEEQLDRTSASPNSLMASISSSSDGLLELPPELPDIDAGSLNADDFTEESTWSNLAISYPLSSIIHRPVVTRIDSRSPSVQSVASPGGSDQSSYTSSAHSYASAHSVSHSSGTTTRGVLRDGSGGDLHHPHHHHPYPGSEFDSDYNSPPAQGDGMGGIFTGLLKAVGFIRHSSSPGRMTADMTLSQLPIRQATLMNLSRLGVSVLQYRPDDAESPFLTRQFLDVSAAPLGLDAVLALVRARAPDFLPSQLQLQVPHHPYVDVIPLRGFRDNILRLLARAPHLLNESDLCDDIDRCLRVWGKTPWEARSLEWSQEFVDRWSWLMDAESINNSNFWRLQRGEDRLRWDGPPPLL